MKATATIPAKNDGGFGLRGGNRNMSGQSWD